MSSPAEKLSAETIRQYETGYVLYPWVAQKGLNPLVIDHAKGNYFYDPAGKKYLDFTSMFVFTNLGHAVAALTRSRTPREPPARRRH